MGISQLRPAVTGTRSTSGAGRRSPSSVATRSRSRRLRGSRICGWARSKSGSTSICALGRHGELVGELEELVAEHPLRERIRGQLMLALYRSGRQAEALDVYRRFRRTLVEELGIEPGPPLQELERAILTQDASLELERTASVTPGPAGSVLVVASSDTRPRPAAHPRRAPCQTDGPRADPCPPSRRRA